MALLHTTKTWWGVSDIIRLDYTVWNTAVWWRNLAKLHPLINYSVKCEGLIGWNMRRRFIHAHCAHVASCTLVEISTFWTCCLSLGDRGGSLFLWNWSTRLADKMLAHFMKTLDIIATSTRTSCLAIWLYIHEFNFQNVFLMRLFLLYVGRSSSKVS